MSTDPGATPTMEGQSLPGVRQLSVFLENRVGQLLRLTQLIDQEHIRMLGLSVVDSLDCAIVRLLFDAPSQARDILTRGGFAVSVAEILVVRLPPGRRGMLSILQCLLSCEVNVGYCYPLMPVQLGPAIALAVDNIEIASDALIRHKFDVLGEDDLKLAY